MDAKERALLDLRQGLWNNLKYMMDAHANGIVSNDELRARYDGMYQEIYEVDRRIEEWRALEKTFIEKSKSREPVITHQRVGYDVVNVDVEYDQHKFTEQMDMVEKSVGYDKAVFPETRVLTGTVTGGATARPVSPELEAMWADHPELRGMSIMQMLAYADKMTREEPAILKVRAEREKAKHERGITYLKPEYERYKEEFATTGDEEAFEKMLDCVVIE